MKRSVFQEICDSEINFSISCFWDGGFKIELGDVVNEIKEEKWVDTWEDVRAALVEMVLIHYPDSEFAKSVEAKKDQIVIVCQPRMADRVRAVLAAHNKEKDGEETKEA